MIRTVPHSNNQLNKENDESILKGKDPRLSSIKSEIATTPRRAFGLITNQKTPASTIKSSLITKSPIKRAPMLVFEDDDDEQEEAAATENSPDSFEVICSKFEKSLSPWKEYPEIENFGTAPLVIPALMPESADFIDLDNSFEQMCAELYVKPEPWSEEECPPIEYAPENDVAYDFYEDYKVPRCRSVSLHDDNIECSYTRNSDYNSDCDSDSDEINEAAWEKFYNTPLEFDNF